MDVDDMISFGPRRTYPSTLVVNGSVHLTHTAQLSADVRGTDEVCHSAPGPVVPGVVGEVAGTHALGECGDHFRAGAGTTQHDGHRRLRVRRSGAFGPVTDEAHGMRGDGSAERRPQIVDTPVQPVEVGEGDLVGNEPALQ
ncbi:hypothetical protein, partial [Streptomyces althioticus]|uniref:hypothetical protein n=1 Tax=Streptomyces althioticus TaxID=83380 RepID=UPI0036F9EF32